MPRTPSNLPDGCTDEDVENAFHNNGGIFIKEQEEIEDEHFDIQRWKAEVSKGTQDL